MVIGASFVVLASLLSPSSWVFLVRHYIKKKGGLFAFSEEFAAVIVFSSDVIVSIFC